MGELSPAIGPTHFTIANAATRLGALKSIPWTDFRNAAAPLRRAKRR